MRSHGMEMAVVIGGNPCLCNDIVTCEFDLRILVDYKSIS